MAATLAGAIKAYLEAQGLGVAVWKEAPPSKASLRDSITKLLKAPFCVVMEGISVTPLPMEDGGPAAGGTRSVVELVQLDLYQNWRGAKDEPLESATLADGISGALDGVSLPAAPKRAYGIRQQNRIKTVDRDARLVRYTYTLAVTRAI